MLWFIFKYSGLSSLREDFPRVPIIAVTATANVQMRDEIIKRLGIKDCVRLQGSINCPNLNYEIRKKPRHIFEDMVQFITEKHPGHMGIIYCSTRLKCEDVAKKLNNNGLKAKHFHSSLISDDKERTLNAWSNGVCHIIVATVSCHTNFIMFMCYSYKSRSLLGWVFRMTAVYCSNFITIQEQY